MTLRDALFLSPCPLGEKKSAFATSKVKAAVPVLPLRTEAYSTPPHPPPPQWFLPPPQKSPNLRLNKCNLFHWLWNRPTSHSTTRTSWLGLHRHLWFSWKTLPQQLAKRPPPPPTTELWSTVTSRPRGSRAPLWRPRWPGPRHRCVIPTRSSPPQPHSLCR